MKPDLKVVVSHFQVDGEVSDIRPYGTGHINATYLVEVDSAQRYILQGINHHVFKRPDHVMANIERITAHLRQKIVHAGGDPRRETLTLISTRDGRSYYQSPAGEYWRLELFIDGAETHQIVPDSRLYYEAANAYGRFQRMLADFPVDHLYTTIPDFHHTAKRLAAFETAVTQDRVGRKAEVAEEIGFIRERAAMAPVLTDLQEAGHIPLRVTHNDAKFDNVMIDSKSARAVCVIDLDTVMPGIALFDFADAVRSGANRVTEDDPRIDEVYFDLAIFERLAKGYLDAAREHLTAVEIDHPAFAARLLTYEQAMRFLADYLNGDSYYRINYAGHNLVRTRNQIRLLQLMEANHQQMDDIISKHRG